MLLHRDSHPTNGTQGKIFFFTSRSLRFPRALCLSILLYGSDIWCLREDLFNRLRHFHHRCARIMCRITIAHTIRHRIPSASFIKRLSIEPFDTYYSRRLLRWTGHVARMPLTRAPRKVLTSWVDNLEVAHNWTGAELWKDHSETWPSNWLCKMALDGGWSKSMACNLRI
jgi:hypothetical protein